MDKRGEEDMAGLPMNQFLIIILIVALALAIFAFIFRILGGFNV